MKGFVFFSATVLLLLAWEGFGVHGKVMDYMVSFQANLPGFSLQAFKELPDGNFAFVVKPRDDPKTCMYRRLDRNTGVLSKAVLLEGGCEYVAWAEDGSFATKAYPCDFGRSCPPGYKFADVYPWKADELDYFIADYVRKYDSRGQLLWRAPFAIHEDEYVPGNLAVFSDGSVVADNDFPVKYSASGKVLWEAEDVIPKNYGIKRGGGIVEVENGNVLVTTNDYYSAVAVHKVTPSGRKLWTKVLQRGCRADERLSPVVSSGGNYYAGCTTGYSPSYGDKIDQGDYRVYKLSPKSKLLWTKTVKAPGDEQLYHLIPEDDGGVLLIGRSGSSKGQDKMAEHEGQWFVKLDARGNVEWDFVPTDKGASETWAKSSRGYLSHGGPASGFVELVINQPLASKDLPSGSVIAIKSEENNRYIRLSNKIYADAKAVTFSGEWMILKDKQEDSSFALRSLGNGKVASLSEVKPSKVVLKAITAAVDPRSKRHRFEIRNLGRGSVAFLSDSRNYGYLRPALTDGRVLAKPSKQSDRKMRITRIHSGHPLIGSEIVLRMNSKNVLIESSPSGKITATRTFLGKDRDPFVFKVAATDSPRGFIQLKSKASGKWLVVSSAQRVNAIGAKSSPNSMFYPIISREGYIKLARRGLDCLWVKGKGGLYAGGKLSKTSCEILFAPIKP
ncbi:hypothetical protein NDN08_004937 [Rhodosorus marinus]|uniref:Uncharacterized protein n=1 Tax=Rhodosorus marinus TaxID=101924 RepID=A0AAV8UIH8_9RHOD|nr:hypothetical protein NDN08_004937 [Rhodosorus marinus]